MAAFMVVHLTMRDPSWLPEYLKHVPAIIKSHGGEFVGVSGAVARLEGNLPVPGQIGILSFPSTQAIELFLADERYQPYKDARNKGADVSIFSFEHAG
jgi:uncharacterized protein (DUF1330 family)